MNLADYRLYLVTDDSQSLDEFGAVVRGAVEGGVTMVQVREKHGDVRTFIERAELAKSLLAGSGVPLIINDRVDVALAVDADGVHLGQSDMAATTTRRLIGADKILGLTVESPAQLRSAQALPVDYLGISTVLPTPTKTDTRFVWGIDGLARAVIDSALPLVAIGGLNRDNLDQVMATGTAGVALVSAICRADDPVAATRALRRQLGF